MSQRLRDPGLTEHGVQMAKEYGPKLRGKLRSLGLDVENAFIGSSGLLRAKETARLVFGREPVTVSHFKENGAIPENTPQSVSYSSPDWRAFLKELAHKLYREKRDSAVVVGHGSFLAKQVWPALKSGSAPYHRKLNNLDGFLVTGTLSPDGKLTVESVREVRNPSHLHRKYTHRRNDKCSVRTQHMLIEKHIQNHTQNQNQNHKSRFTRKRQKQAGGFTPSIMGGFASNGLRYALPAAMWSAYHLFKNQ